MRRLFFYQIALIIWFFFFYNVERLITPINIASFVYVLAPSIAVLILILPVVSNWPSIRLFLLSLIPFFLLKFILGYEIAGLNLPVTVTEMTALYITIFLTHYLVQDLRRILKEITLLTIGSHKNGVNEFSTGQAEIYREVRRARRFNRPAALLTVAASGETIELAMNRFIEEAQNGILKSYVNARIANLLEGQLKDSDVITKYNNYFVILLPETGQEQVTSVVKRLKKLAAEKLELSLEIGYSTFPDEAVTFSELLEQAETRMLCPESTAEAFDSESDVAAESTTFDAN